MTSTVPSGSPFPDTQKEYNLGIYKVTSELIIVDLYMTFFCIYTKPPGCV